MWDVRLDAQGSVGGVQMWDVNARGGDLMRRYVTCSDFFWKHLFRDWLNFH